MRNAFFVIYYFGGHSINFGQVRYAIILVVQDCSANYIKRRISPGEVVYIMTVTPKINVTTMALKIQKYTANTLPPNLHEQYMNLTHR
jgi:hypothetical protein